MFIAIVANAIIGHSQPLDDYTISTLHWTPLSQLPPISAEVGFSEFPFTAGKIVSVRGIYDKSRRFCDSERALGACAEPTRL